jgi:hypothetical protein
MVISISRVNLCLYNLFKGLLQTIYKGIKDIPGLQEKVEHLISEYRQTLLRQKRTKIATSPLGKKDLRAAVTASCAVISRDSGRTIKYFTNMSSAIFAKSLMAKGNAEEIQRRAAGMAHLLGFIETEQDSRGIEDIQERCLPAGSQR